MPKVTKRTKQGRHTKQDFIGRITHNGIVVDDFITVEEPTEGWVYLSDPSKHPEFHSVPMLFNLVGFDRDHGIMWTPLQGSTGDTPEDHQEGFPYRAEVYSRDDKYYAPDHFELSIPEDTVGKGDLTLLVTGTDTNGVQGTAKVVLDYNKEIPPTPEPYVMEFPCPDDDGILHKEKYTCTMISDFPESEYRHYFEVSTSGSFSAEDPHPQEHAGKTYVLELQEILGEQGYSTHSVTAVVKNLRTDKIAAVQSWYFIQPDGRLGYWRDHI